MKKKYLYKIEEAEMKKARLICCLLLERKGYEEVKSFLLKLGKAEEGQR